MASITEIGPGPVLDGVRSSAYEQERLGGLYILKFGGSSLRDAAGVTRVASVIDGHRRNGEPVVVVVSAMSEVTNRLVELAQAAEDGQGKRIEEILSEVTYKHVEVARNLGLGIVRETGLYFGVRRLLMMLDEDVFSGRLPAFERRDRILSYGVRLSARLVAVRCENAQAVDASEVIVTDDNFGSAEPILDLTEEKAQRVLIPLLKAGITPVLTGFFGATKDGRITILGRNCSDKTAAVLARVMGAKELILYKDENGICDSDPKSNPGAKLLDTVSFDEYPNIPGAQKVVHPDTVKLLCDSDTKIWVRSIFNPEQEGTKLLRSSQPGRERL